MIARMNVAPSWLGSRPASRSGSGSAILMPLTNSIVSTRLDDSSS